MSFAICGGSAGRNILIAAYIHQIAKLINTSATYLQSLCNSLIPRAIFFNKIPVIGDVNK